MTADELKVLITAQTTDFNSKITQVNNRINDMTQYAQKSTAKTSGMFGKIGKAAVVAFAGKAIFDAGKQAVSYASDLQEVQNVVDTAFGDMAYKAEEFAATAIEQFGMSEVSAKKASSTYMAMSKGMGLADHAASDMAINVAKLTGDVASFYGISQDLASVKLKAIWTGETEGLKDLGVVMTQANLQQYAYRIGINKNIDTMTQAELVTLRYKYVMDQLSLAQGDFAKNSGSWANQVRQLQENWKSLMGTIGQSLIEVLTPALQWINGLLQGLQKGAQAVYSFVRGLFGIEPVADSGASDVVSGTDDMSEGFNDVTDSVGKAKKAMSSLAGFDQLTTIGSGQSGADGDTATIPGVPNISPGSDDEESENESKSIADEIADKFENLGARFKNTLNDIISPLKAISFDNAIDAFERLKKSIEPFTRSLFDGLSWGWNNVIVPMAEFSVEEVLPRFMDTLGESLGIAGEAMDGVNTVFQPFWNNCLRKIVNFGADKFLKFWDKFNEDLSDLKNMVKDTDMFDNLSSILEKLSPAIESVGKSIINFASTQINWIWEQGLVEIKYKFEEIEDAVGAVSSLMNGDFLGAFKKLGKLATNPIRKTIDKFKALGKSILDFTGLSDDAVKSIDVLGDGISEATRVKVKPLIDQMRSLDDVIAGIDMGAIKIDQSVVDDVAQKTKAISTTIINELDSDKNAALATLEPLKAALGEDAYRELMDDTNTYYTNLSNKVVEGETRINEIVAAASEEKRKLTQQEKDEINQIKDEMNQTGIMHLSESEVEYNKIMNRLKDNSTRVSLEQASEIIKNAKQTRDETIESAETQYSRQELEAKRMLEVGQINQEEYNAIIEAAKKTKEDTIAEAEEQYNTIIDTTKTKLGDNAKNIDTETGKIKSKWEVFCSSISEKWDGAWDAVSKGWENFKTGFKTGWDNFWGGLKTGWENFWGGISDGWNDFWNGVGDFFGLGSSKSTIDQIHASAGALRIPKLASGGIVSAPTIAVVGEYAGAHSNPEVIAPLDRLEAMLTQSNGGNQSGVIAALFEICDRLERAIEDGKVIELDGVKVGASTTPYVQKEMRRIGNQVIVY